MEQKVQKKCKKCDANAICEHGAKALRCDGIGQKCVCECEKLFALPSLRLDMMIYVCSKWIDINFKMLWSTLGLSLLFQFY
jgi:hypothetical protein